MHVSCVFRTSAEGNTPRGVPHRVQSNVDAAETPSDGLMPQSHLATLTSLLTVHITSYAFLLFAMLQNKGNPPCGRTPTVIATFFC
jgi:hypothetical protein